MTSVDGRQPVVRLPVNTTLDAAKVRDDARWSRQKATRTPRSSSRTRPTSPDPAGHRGQPQRDLHVLRQRRQASSQLEGNSARAEPRVAEVTSTGTRTCWQLTAAATPPVARRAPGPQQDGRGAFPGCSSPRRLLLALVFKFLPMVKGSGSASTRCGPSSATSGSASRTTRAVLTDDRFQAALGHTLVLGLGQTLGALLVGFAAGPAARRAARGPVVRAHGRLPAGGHRDRRGRRDLADPVLPDRRRLRSTPSRLPRPRPAQFLDDPYTALWSSMVVGIWTRAPYNMVIILAGLAGVDRTCTRPPPSTAPRVWQRLRYVDAARDCAPRSRIVLTLAAIRGLRSFTEVYVLTGGGPPARPRCG